MSEELQGGYQTAPIEGNEPPVTPNEPAIPQEPVSPPQENVFTVKYNKEEMQIPYEQAPEYIQKGLNYDKVQGKVSEYEQRIKDIAEITGYQSPEELFQALEQAKKEQEAERYRQAGIDPDTFNHLLESHPDIQFAREMKAKQEQEARFQQEANELFQEFPDLKPEQIPQEVWQLKEQRGLSLLDAYLRVSYKNLGQQKEQEAIQKLQGNAQASTGSLGGGDVQHNTSIKDMPKQDFESLLRRVKAGEVRSL